MREEKGSGGLFFERNTDRAHGRKTKRTRTFDRLLQRFDELLEFSLLDRPEYVVHTDGLSLAISAELVSGGGQVMDEDLRRLVKRRESLLLHVPLRDVPLGVSAVLGHELGELVLNEPLNVRGGKRVFRHGDYLDAARNAQRGSTPEGSPSRHGSKLVASLDRGV